MEIVFDFKTLKILIFIKAHVRKPFTYILTIK